MGLAASHDAHGDGLFSEQIKQDAEGFVPGLEEPMNPNEIQIAKKLVAEWQS
jgi:hypothetical protein